SPTSMRAASFSIEITRPLMTVPSRPLATPSDSSSSAAKLSLTPVSAVSVATAIPSPRSRIGETRLRRDHSGAGGRRGNRVRPRQPGPANRTRQNSTAMRQPKASADCRRQKLFAASGKGAGNELGDLLEHLIGIEPGRIDDDGVGSRRERRHPTLAVARVAFLHVLKDI